MMGECKKCGRPIDEEALRDGFCPYCAAENDQRKKKSGQRIIAALGLGFGLIMTVVAVIRGFSQVLAFLEGVTGPVDDIIVAVVGIVISFLIRIVFSAMGWVISTKTKL